MKASVIESTHRRNAIMRMTCCAGCVFCGLDIDFPVNMSWLEMHCIEWSWRYPLRCQFAEVRVVKSKLSCLNLFIRTFFVDLLC